MAKVFGKSTKEIQAHKRKMDALRKKGEKMLPVGLAEGCPDAQYELGMRLIQYARGVKNARIWMTKAVRWLHRAAIQGHYAAADKLSWLYGFGSEQLYNNTAIPKDDEKCTMYYNMAFALEPGYSQKVKAVYTGEGMSEYTKALGHTPLTSDVFPIEEAVEIGGPILTARCEYRPAR